HQQLAAQNLRGVRFVEADLYGCDLKKADLREADLEGANLNEALLKGADLRGANLRRVNLKGVDLRGVRLDVPQAVVLAQCYGAIVEYECLQDGMDASIRGVESSQCATILACRCTRRLSPQRSPNSFRERFL